MMATNKINALLICPNKIPKLIEISNTLSEHQKLVHGKIEVCYLPTDNEVCIICNENGKFDGSIANRDIGCDIIYGDFLIVGNDLVNGDFKSLTKQQIENYSNMFDKKSITRTKNRLIARKLATALMYRRN